MSDTSRKIDNPLICLEIESLSSSGEGIARAEGVVHFVPRALPGERCEAEVVQRKKHWRRAHLRRVLRASPERISPECPFYDDCGGCQLQHLNYPAQCEFKRTALADTLRRIGHFEIEPAPVTVSKPFGYRRKVTFAAKRAGGRLQLALHRWDDPRLIVPVSNCLQLEPALNARLESVGVWINETLPKGVQNNLRHVVIQQEQEDNEPCVVILRFEKPLREWKSLQRLSLPDGVGAVYASLERPGARLHRVRRETSTALFPGAFRQANREIAQALYERILDWVPEGCDSALDAYAGAGEAALGLAKRAGRVIAIEQDRDAIQAARFRAKTSDAGDRVEIVRGRVEERLGQFLPADFVVLDPPRAGCDTRVLEPLLERPPKRLAYVSCHPAALARDLRRLVDGGFELEKVIPFDMFPQTHHLEVLALLRDDG